MRLESGEAIVQLLTQVKRIALVGASAKPERPSHRVMQFLLDEGYEVLPSTQASRGSDCWDKRYTPLWQTSRPASTWQIFFATPRHCPRSHRTLWLPGYPQCGHS